MCPQQVRELEKAVKHFMSQEAQSSSSHTCKHGVGLKRPLGVGSHVVVGSIGRPTSRHREGSASRRTDPSSPSGYACGAHSTPADCSLSCLQAERDSEKVKELQDLLAAETKKTAELQKQLDDSARETQQRNDMFARLQNESQHDLKEERSNWEQLQKGYEAKLQELGSQNSRLIEEGASSPQHLLP